MTDKTFKVKLTKLDDFYTGDDPARKALDNGKSREGITNSIPVVGKRFYVVGDGKMYSTSPVQEILSEDTFKTYNSIYKWERI